VNGGVGVLTEEETVWNVGEMATVTWDSDSIDALVNANRGNAIKVDISIGTYDTDGLLQQETMLASDLPNSGSATVPLPEALNSTLTTSENSLLIGIVKVGVNSSTTNLVQVKRFAVSQRFRKILGKVGQFARARAIGSIKSSIARRIACEGWVALAPPVPRRTLPPCPCNDADAVNDGRYQEEKSGVAGSLLRRYLFHRGSRSCYRQANVR
jgi:hypothetical protein